MGGSSIPKHVSLVGEIVVRRAYSLPGGTNYAWGSTIGFHVLPASAAFGNHEIQVSFPDSIAYTGHCVSYCPARSSVNLQNLFA